MRRYLLEISYNIPIDFVSQMIAVLMPSNPYLYAVFARFLSSVLPSLSPAALQPLLPPTIALLERIASRRTDCTLSDFLS